MNQSAKYQGIAGEASKTFGGHLKSWWNWFTDDFSQGMNNANKTLGEFIDKLEKSKNLRKTVDSGATALGSVHGDTGDDPYRIRALIDAQNAWHNSVADFERIDMSATTASFKGMAENIQKVRLEMNKLYDAKKRIADEDFYSLSGDQRSNLNYQPSLETAADYEQRLKQLRGDDKNLTGDIVGLERERVELLKQMEGMDLDVDMDSYIAAREVVAQIDQSLMIWHEQLQKVNDEMDTVAEGRTAKIDADISKFETEMAKAEKEMLNLSQVIELNVDNTQALANIQAVKNQMMELQAITYQTYTMEMMMARSPAKPWHQGYSELMDEIAAIPGGSQYTMRVGGGDGVNMDTSQVGRSFQYTTGQDFSGADPRLLSQLNEAIRMMTAYGQGAVPFMASTPSTFNMASFYQDMIPRLEAKALASKESRSIVLNMGGGVNISVNGSGGSALDVSKLAEQIDRELANMVGSNRSRLQGALDASGV
jgi:hypothetical protein